jgi:hypothetical protein
MVMQGARAWSWTIRFLTAFAISGFFGLTSADYGRISRALREHWIREKT